MSTGEKAKATATNILAKTKTLAFRTTQKAMVKLGKAEETVDIQFSQENEKFTNHYRAIKKIKKDTAQFLQTLRDLAVLQATIADDLYQMYETKASNYNATLKNQDIAKLLDAARLAFDEQVRKDFLDPTSKYLGQFKETKGRIAERNTRKVDMDRYGRDLRILQEKATNQAKISISQQKYDAAISNYNQLNDELLQDLPRLYEDRIPFFDPLLATYTIGMAEYYRSCAKSSSEIMNLVQQIDRQAIHNHQRVVTPAEASSAKFKATVGTVNPAKAYPGATSDENPYSHASAPLEPSAPHHPMPSHPAPANPGRQSPVAPSRIALPKAKAVYDFNPAEANELGFRVGDVIMIHKQTGDWWEGELNGKKGLLPSNYVQLL